FRLINQLKQKLETSGLRLLPSNTPIQPVLVGGVQDVVRISEGLKAQGILVPAIRPPTVPQNTARLRISLSASHQEADITRLADALRYLA
ncbi:aminotransferase class I/II-fold pyridoxal phosphate-dependent enzyme, partial [Nitrosomonas sp.]|uniref:aminotransferase class I/II-fold pyridoxal phosphate-dependent enzyme n=1 Tax=Nitrosomonas sp. TaxID=42353 RepID=UPI001DD47949